MTSAPERARKGGFWAFVIVRERAKVLGTVSKKEAVERSTGGFVVKQKGGGGKNEDVTKKS